MVAATAAEARAVEVRVVAAKEAAAREAAAKEAAAREEAAKEAAAARAAATEAARAAATEAARLEVGAISAACWTARLRDCEERVARELAAEEGVELVGGDHAGAREHGDSAVLQLRLAEPTRAHAASFPPGSPQRERRPGSGDAAGRRRRAAAHLAIVSGDASLEKPSGSK